MDFKFFFQSMEVSSIWYFSFWSLISVVFSATGIYALHRATIPVSYELQDFLEGNFELLVTLSISYAFICRPSLEEHRRHVLKNAPSSEIFSHHLNCFAGLSLLFLHFVVVVHYLILSPRNLWASVMRISFLIFYFSWFSLILKLIISGLKNSQTIGNFFTGLVVPLSLFPHHNFLWVLFQGFWLLSSIVHESPVDWVSRMVGFYGVGAALGLAGAILHFENKSIATPSLIASARQQLRLIEIVCGTLASTVAQYWFRVQSVPLMLGFLSLAMASLGILANINPLADFGLLEFFVSMSLQSAVSLFGLHFYTFLVVLWGIVLMLVKWKLEYVSLRHFGKQEIIAMDVKHWEELFEVIVSDSKFRRHVLMMVYPDFPTEQPRNNDCITEEP